MVKYHKNMVDHKFNDILMVLHWYISWIDQFFVTWSGKSSFFVTWSWVDDGFFPLEMTPKKIQTVFFEGDWRILFCSSRKLIYPIYIINCIPEVIFCFNPSILWEYSWLYRRHMLHIIYGYHWISFVKWESLDCILCVTLW